MPKEQNKKSVCSECHGFVWLNVEKERLCTCCFGYGWITNDSLCTKCNGFGMERYITRQACGSCGGTREADK